MTTRALQPPIRLLVVNPNSSQSMTGGVEEAIEASGISETVQIHTYTAPAESPASIDNNQDIHLSTKVVLGSLITAGKLKEYDGVLVACFSVHPLVQSLAAEQGSKGLLSVTGIFEASILTSLSLLTNSPSLNPPVRTWGIVTTGKFWEDHLTAGVKAFLGHDDQSGNLNFVGVESTGLVASDFHSGVNPSVIEERLKEATRRLLQRGDVQCVAMGCAGMAGLEGIIRNVAVEVYGKEKGNLVYIIDGVKAGIGLLEQMVRNKRMFQTQ